MVNEIEEDDKKATTKLLELSKKNNKETESDINDDPWNRVKTLHYAAVWLHGVLLVFCVAVIIKTLPETPSLGKVKCFNSWPVWDSNSTRSSETRVTIFHKWDHCIRKNLSRSAKKQCDMDVEELDISLVMILLFTQTFTFFGHVVQYNLCRNKSKTFKQLSRCGIKIVFWIEYTFSASFIAVVTSYLSGNVDIKSLLLILSSQSTLMLLGLLIDVLRHLKESLLPYHDDKVFREMLGSDLSFACRPNYYETEGGGTLVRMISCCPILDSYTLLMAFIFLVGFFNLACQWIPGLIKVIDSIGTDMPTWIVGLYFAELLLYISFGLVQVYYTLCKRQKRYMLDEHNCHTVLSFFSKATLVLFFMMYFVRDADNRAYGVGSGIGTMNTTRF